jgi:uncharacterized membrane protein YjjP (DUF1212 family)
MNLELIPVIVGGFVGLIGLILVFDAWTPDQTIFRKERRRSPRLERSRGGEAMVGLGVMCMAAAFIGRDTWVYSVVSVIAGTVLLIFGTIASRKYLGEVIGNRGKLRRREQ